MATAGVTQFTRTPDEAVKKANDTEYGLAAGVWTEKTSKLFEVAHRLNAGVVWANGYNMFDAASPFGGVRHSVPELVWTNEPSARALRRWGLPVG